MSGPDRTARERGHAKLRLLEQDDPERVAFSDTSAFWWSGQHAGYENDIRRQPCVPRVRRALVDVRDVVEHMLTVRRARRLCSIGAKAKAYFNQANGNFIFKVEWAAEPDANGGFVRQVDELDDRQDELTPVKSWRGARSSLDSGGDDCQAAASTKHYGRAAKRYEGVRDEPLDAASLPTHLRQTTSFPTRGTSTRSSGSSGAAPGRRMMSGQCRSSSTSAHRCKATLLGRRLGARRVFTMTASNRFFVRGVMSSRARPVPSH